MTEANTTLASQTEDRARLLESIGTETKTLRWSEDLGFGWLMGYYLLILYISPLGIAWLPMSSDLRLIVWLVFPIPFAVIAWWIIRRKSIGRSITFSATGFRFYRDRDCYFEQNWSWITGVEFRRDGLFIDQRGGDRQMVRVPDVKRSRDSDLLRKILRTYATPKDQKLIARRWLAISSVLTIVGGIACVVVGRPEMLRKDFEGSIGSQGIMLAIFWALSACIGILGFFGLMTTLTMFVLKKEEEKGSKRVSRFGPNIQSFLDSCERWPAPVELVPGKQYRYIDPDSIVSTAKDRLTGYWIMMTFASLFAVTAGIGAFQSYQLRKSDTSGLIIASLGCLAGAIWCVFGLRHQRQKANVSEDIISVVGTNLLVKRDGRLLTYPRHAQKVMKDSVPKKETRIPFGKLERHGKKPDVYEIDRRYLMEIPDQD